MAQKRKKKKSRGGQIAVPFLVALLLGVLGMGSVALFVSNHLSIGKDKIVAWNSTVKKPTAEDNMTILFVLNEESDPCPLTFLTVRLLPERKQVVFFSFPTNMLAAVDGKTDTLAGYFQNGGVQRVETAIENETGIHIDRYAVLGTEGFQKICNIFGGVYYVVPDNIIGFADSKTPQYLGPHQIEKLVTYSLFDESAGQNEIMRSMLTADLINEMFNVTDSDRERLLSSMDSNFKALINKMDTDITSVDYNEHKDALKYMMTYGKSIGSFRMVTGSLGEEGDVFLISDTFYNSVKEFFEEAPEVVTIAPEEEEAS